MRFAWDPEKARHNLAKHGISFALAQRVWDDPLHTIASDRTVDGEERWLAVGLVGPSLVLVVAHVYREDHGGVVRIVNARKATPHERRRYEHEAF